MALHRVFIKGTNDKVTLLQKFFKYCHRGSHFPVVFLFSAKRLNINFDFSFLWTFRYRLIKGFATTVELSLVSLILSLLLGFVCYGQQFTNFGCFLFSKVYVQFLEAHRNDYADLSFFTSLVPPGVLTTGFWQGFNPFAF